MTAHIVAADQATNQNLNLPMKALCGVTFSLGIGNLSEERCIICGMMLNTMFLWVYSLPGSETA